MKIRLAGVALDKYHCYHRSPTEVTYFLLAIGKSQVDITWAKIFMRIYNSVFIKIRGKLWER